MRLVLLITALPLALTGIAYLCAPPLLHRDLTLLDAVLLNAATLASIAWARRRRKRLHRQQAESMRDSALW